MSADITGTPLRDVLSEISRQTGMIVRIEEGLQGSVSKHISKLPLEEGLKRILSDYSYTMVYSENEQGEIVPKEVKVFKKGNAAPKFERLKTPAIPRREAPPAPEDEGEAKEEAPAREEPEQEAPPKGEGEGESEGGESAPSVEAPENTSSSLQTKQARADMMRIRREIAELRQSLRENQNGEQGASIRSEITRKTVELKQREAWLKARAQGFERMERQQTGR